MNSINDCRSYFQALTQTVELLPAVDIERVARLLLTAFEENRAVFLFGNGGSAALASHFACDLGKGTASRNGRRFRVMALTDNVPILTAWANDSHYDNIFAEQLVNFVSPDDVAFAISASGNSPNVIKALQVARRAGAVTIGLTGYAGGKMKRLCDACIVIPCENMQLIEDLHLSVAHALFTVLRQRICHPQADVWSGPRVIRWSLGR